MRPVKVKATALLKDGFRLKDWQMSAVDVLRCRVAKTTVVLFEVPKDEKIVLVVRGGDG